MKRVIEAKEVAGQSPNYLLAKVQDLVEVPVTQERVVNGVATRASADGTTVFAQLDAGHWAQGYSEAAGVDLLRQAVSLVTVR